MTILHSCVLIDENIVRKDGIFSIFPKQMDSLINNDEGYNNCYFFKYITSSGCLTKEDLLANPSLAQGETLVLIAVVKSFAPIFTSLDLFTEKNYDDLVSIPPCSQVYYTP